ncbi:MAG: sigma-70 family RNA polymerase sigma factor [Clostridia bacterium]|nr:sigma-70 family RNA polymerase sigma factor [Clostridia bacterium]
MLEDSKIIELFFARSEKAIEAVAEKYGKACFKVAFNILNNYEDSEECVNDSYLGAWNSIPPKKPNPLMSYILRLVRNCALNRFDYNSAKKRAGNYAVCLDEIGYKIEADETPETSFEMKQLTVYINEFLESISKANRILFIRRYWFMDTYEEISEMTGIKTGALKVRVMRIRNELKEFLGTKGVEI